VRRNRFFKPFGLACSICVLLLTACSPGPAPTTSPKMPTPTLALPAATAIPPSPTPTVPPSPAPTAEPGCPEPTERTQLLANERYGYCLLYPAGYFLTGFPHQVCIAPDGFVFWETPCPVSIGVLDASGRSVHQLADGRMAQIGFDPGRSRLIIGGEEAVVLADVGAQSSMQEVLIVHEDRLYTLAFPLPEYESLHTTIINSFTFVPTVPSPAETRATHGTARVVYVKEGDILVWEEATSQTQTIFKAGDVTQVKLSDDGQLVAFLRQGSPSLWVVERNGQNPRQLDPAQGMEWIPNSHRLLYSPFFAAISGWFYQGLTLLDADTLARADIVPEEEFVSFMPSPDGEYIALVTSTGLYLVNVEDSLSGQVHLSPMADGVLDPYNLEDSSPVWTQDSRAFLVKGSIVFTRAEDPRFTIWRVPVDGASAEPLITLRGTQDQLAPDGSVLAFVRSTGPLGATRRFILPLPEEPGPLAVLSDPLGLSWSPDNVAYIRGPEEMSPLCPSAAQAIEVCAPPIPFGTDIESFEWLDRDRFLYVTYVPRRLMLGSLDGSVTVIAEDPQGPVDFSNAVRDSFDAVAATCEDDAEFVSDVTVPDGTSLAPGTFFTKTWRLRNTGTCTWDEAYRFMFLSGDRLSGPRGAPIGEPVEPGEEIEVPVMLITPEAAGTYQGQWQLFAPDGTPFGTAPYVVIQVR